MSDQPVSRRTKAVIAGAVAGTGALAVAGVDNAFTIGELVAVLATTAAAVGAVYGVTSKGEVEPEGKHEAPSPGDEADPADAHPLEAYLDEPGGAS